MVGLSSFQYRLREGGVRATSGDGPDSTEPTITVRVGSRGDFA